MSLPAGLVAGDQVFVCENLAFCDEVKVSLKHTRFILRDLPGPIGGAMERLIGRRREQDRRVEACHARKVSARNGSALSKSSTMR